MPAPSREIRAEAPACLARLHAENRDAADEAAFRTWLSADPAHAAAFEAVDRMWRDIGGLGNLTTNRTALKPSVALVPVASPGLASRRLLLAGVGLLAVTGGSAL